MEGEGSDVLVSEIVPLEPRDPHVFGERLGHAGQGAPTQLVSLEQGIELVSIRPEGHLPQLSL